MIAHIYNPVKPFDKFTARKLRSIKKKKRSHYFLHLRSSFQHDIILVSVGGGGEKNRLSRKTFIYYIINEASFVFVKISRLIVCVYIYGTPNEKKKRIKI